MGGNERWRSAVRLAVAFVCVLGVAASASAQFDRGTIVGTIKDQQGGIVPGVTVTLTSTQTQQTRTTVTDGSGFYTFPNLQPGRYEVTAELSGFKKFSRSNVQVDATQSLALDVVLEAGALTESVTVTAEASALQTDVAVRKSVEAKDIELLSFSGRNPIGVPALKAGVVGGNFNNAGFAAFTNGGFSINGGRPDENTITVDGAVAIRTRSAGTIIGTQNVDTVQEVQVLTANYMPEYGRASAGQIRFVTKSGSNRYTGNASYFWRDDSLQANTWTRNRSTNPADQDPAAFDYKQYGYSFGGPIPGEMFRNKVFFFGAQEWVNFFQVETRTNTVPTARMLAGDFGELLGSNQFFSAPRQIRNPVTGEPFANNVIPSNMLSPNGIAIMKLYGPPTPGFQQGSANQIITSDNPQDQRKDNIRVDYRLSNNHQITGRYTYYNWVALDAFRGQFPFARTDWERPNWTSNFNLVSTIGNNIVNEVSYSYSKDQVFINVFTESGLYQRSRTGINYPYIFPGKEIDDKIPTVNIDTFTGFDGGPYPAFSEGPIHVWANTTTYVKGRHTFKAGISLEYSGEDDFDQINVSAIQGGTNNQNGQFEFRNNRTSGLTTGTALADMAMGHFQTYAELGERAFTRWRALATDIFIQDSWKPRSNLTLEGGVRYVIWPPWYSTTNNIANFDQTVYNAANAAVMSPVTGRLLSGPRYNGIVLPGEGFEGEGNDLGVAADPRVQALFIGAPRGFAKTHYNVFEPRFGASYSVDAKTVARASVGVFHNRVTLNDSLLLGGNPPFQPMVAVNNGIVDNPGGVGGAGGTDLAFAMQAIDTEFKHPTAYTWSAGVQREVPFGFVVDATYVGRRGLYLQRERNINQLPEGERNRFPGVAIEALRPYRGYNTIRLSENAARSIYHSLQLSAERRYSNGFRMAVAYTLGKSEDNGSDKRNVLWNSYDDTNFYGPSSFDRTHVLVVSYIYDLPFWRDQNTLMKNLLGGWQISGASFFRTGTPFSITRANDIAGVGGGDQPVDVVGEIYGNANGKFSNGADENFVFNPAAFANPAAGRFGNQTRNRIRNPGDQQWDLAIFKNFNVSGEHRIQFRVEMFNFINHPNLSGPVTDITNANFGRSITKSDARRDIQLALRYMF
jgi:Carboxypeptidase regulatory-like domain